MTCQECQDYGYIVLSEGDWKWCSKCQEDGKPFRSKLYNSDSKEPEEFSVPENK